jgi:benzoyl-CoA reductase/2-hydroxyglutaryl-CoA dehydratase subunit BcrC/BadD/HgdB
MSTIAYTNPFVPPEWIAAHGVRPKWSRLGVGQGAAARSLRRGVCAFAARVTDAAMAGEEAAAVILTTTCDQMRYAAAFLDQNGDVPLFLMNVPSTWQTETARQLYRDELVRLGRFIERVGGIEPTAGRLGQTMLSYDRARAAVFEERPRLSATQFAEKLVEVRSTGAAQQPGCHRVPRHNPRPLPSTGMPLALVGGPLTENDYHLFDRIEQLGGRVVLDGTEGGERTLPAKFDGRRVREDPLGELVRAYFDTIPDVFRRPNTALHQWIAEYVRKRRVRGIVFRRYVWCDLWHAEFERLKQSGPVPILALDADRDDDGGQARISSRLEAFMEMLQ